MRHETDHRFLPVSSIFDDIERKLYYGKLNHGKRDCKEWKTVRG